MALLVVTITFQLSKRGIPIPIPLLLLRAVVAERTITVRLDKLVMVMPRIRRRLVVLPTCLHHLQGNLPAIVNNRIVKAKVGRHLRRLILGLRIFKIRTRGNRVLVKMSHEMAVAFGAFFSFPPPLPFPFAFPLSLDHKSQRGLDGMFFFCCLSL